MATITCLDYRRTDLRTNVLENPFWITSGLVFAAEAKGKGALLFSFPASSGSILVQEVLVENIAEMTAGTTIDIGSGTIATNAVTTDEDITIVDADEYIKTADAVLTSNTVWGPTTTNASDWLSVKAAGTFEAPRFILGADVNVPVVYASVANAGTVFSGSFRVHMLITRIP